MSGIQPCLIDPELLKQYKKAKKESELEANLCEFDPDFISLEDDEEKKKEKTKL